MNYNFNFEFSWTPLPLWIGLVILAGLGAYWWYLRDEPEEQEEDPWQ